MKTPTVAQILADPYTSYWLKDAIRTAFKRDVLDAMRDAELLAKLLNDRWQQVEKSYWQAIENR